MTDISINENESNVLVYDLDKLKEMKKNIGTLNENEHIEIFNIIQKDGLKYTINNNGIFVNMRKLNNTTLEKIDNFIKFCNNNNSILNNDTMIRNSYNEFIVNT